MKIEKTITLHPEFSLHARPAGKFIQIAKSFNSKVTVLKDGKKADARSPLALMSLDAGKGSTITIETEGEDAKEALKALEKLVTEGS